MGPKSKTLAERIARHTVVGKPDECWRWTASTSTQGYPRLGIQIGGNRVRGVSVARAIIHIRDGVPLMNPPEQRWSARHTCDVKWCVNPAHIIPGSMLDNARDMWSRGLGRPHHRFTVEEVQEMRARAASGETQTSIAARFATSQGTVGRIVRRESWTWLD